MRNKNISDSEKRDINQLSRATNKIGFGALVQGLIPIINELTSGEETELHTHAMSEALEELISGGGYTPAHNHVLFADDAPTNTTIATLTTNLTGANNDLVYTSKLDGAAGNKFKIAYVDPDEEEAELGISFAVSEGITTITVNLATDEDKAITTTAEDIKTAIDSNPESLVYVDLAEDNDGKGIVTALAATALANGVDGTPAPVGSFIVHEGTLYIATGKVGTSGATWASIELTAVT